MFSEVWGDEYATLEPAGMCPVMSKKQGLRSKDVACRHGFSSSFPYA